MAAGNAEPENAESSRTRDQKHPTSDPHTHGIFKSRLVSASPVYYGWVVLAVGALGVVLTSPGQTYAISVFIDHFITELGISRSLVSSLYTAGTLTASFALPFVGRQIDRRGPRFMIAVVSLLLGLTCIYMGFVRNALMLGVGFLALRMLGQGSLGLVSRNAINQWWVRRRGLAMGITGMASALLGSGGFPNLINWLIPIFGWRVSYMLLGSLLLLIILPLGAIFIRNRPEDYGLQPDGMTAPSETGGSETTPPIEDNWTLPEAIRTSAFWLVAAGLAFMSMLSTGLTFHFFSIFRDSGLSSTVAASVFIPIAATAAIGSFIIHQGDIAAVDTPGQFSVARLVEASKEGRGDNVITRIAFTPKTLAKDMHLQFQVG